MPALLIGFLLVLTLAFLALSPRSIKQVVNFAIYGIISVFVLWRILGVVIGAGKGRSVSYTEFYDVGVLLVMAVYSIPLLMMIGVIAGLINRRAMKKSRGA